MNLTEDIDHHLAVLKEKYPRLVFTIHTGGTGGCDSCGDSDSASSGVEHHAPDPWVHRAERMRCSSCMWFVEKVADTNAPGLDLVPLGRCRRHAPTMNGYPVVFGSDWCGDHKLDETKVS